MNESKENLEFLAQLLTEYLKRRKLPTALNSRKIIQRNKVACLKMKMKAKTNFNLTTNLLLLLCP